MIIVKYCQLQIVFLPPHEIIHLAHQSVRNRPRVLHVFYLENLEHLPNIILEDSILTLKSIRPMLSKLWPKIRNLRMKWNILVMIKKSV